MFAEDFLADQGYTKEDEGRGWILTTQQLTDLLNKFQTLNQPLFNANISFDDFNSIYTNAFDKGFDECDAQSKGQSEGSNMEVIVGREYEKWIKGSKMPESPKDKPTDAKNIKLSAKEMLPDEFLDSEGYPTKEWLEFLKIYTPDDSLPVQEFVDKYLCDGWWFSERQFIFYEKRNGKRKLELHTGGWSGNEEAINALLSNANLCFYHIRYVKWETGGHYYFEVPIN